MVNVAKKAKVKGTSMATFADAVSYKTRPTCPLAAVFLQDHVLKEQVK